MDRNATLPVGKVPGEILSQLLASFPVSDERVLLGPGIGRDTAAISFGDEVLLVKTDPITFASDRAAYHLVHVNANDIACQGGTPRWLVVTALLPEGSTTPAAVAALFAELNHAAAGIGVSVVGGHTEVTAGLSRPILVGTMLGTTEAAKLISPARAKPGDRILMTRSAGIEGKGEHVQAERAGAGAGELIGHAGQEPALRHGQRDPCEVRKGERHLPLAALAGQSLVDPA